LGAEAGALARGEEGFSAAEDEEGEGLQVCWGGFGCGRRIEDLCVGGLCGSERELRMVGFEVSLGCREERVSVDV
jgi:hypothetical protein